MEVCSVVQSILSAFNSGLDIFRRMGVKHKSRKRNKEAPTQGELQLYDSLHRRPQEIKSGYDRSVAKLGHRFEIGDTIAHTSLAHTLLVLNTGLINIINNALSDDPKKQSMSQRSLLSLSEIAAADAINALSQLDMRLSSSPQLALLEGAAANHARHVAAPDKEDQKKQRRKQEAKGSISNNPFRPARRPAPSPLLARGGWVRPKSNSSVASSASTSKTNVTRPTDHRRSKSSPCLPKESKITPVTSSPTAVRTEPGSPELKVETTPSNEATPHHHRRRHTSSNPRPQREPSMLLVSSDFFSSQHLPQADQTQPQPSAPPIPPKIPLHSRPNTSPNHKSSGPGMRPRPPSVATFMTASTKIGEIPEHLWPDRSAQLAAQERPLLYVIPPPLTPGFGEERKKARGRGFKFWKKSEPVDQYESLEVNGKDLLVC